MIVPRPGAAGVALMEDALPAAARIITRVAVAAQRRGGDVARDLDQAISAAGP